MQDRLTELLEKAKKEITQGADKTTLEAVRIRLLGRKDGELTSILRSLGELSSQERPVIGKLANQVKVEIENLFSARLEQLKEEGPGEIGLDISLPGRPPLVGREHLISRTTDMLVDIFHGMGFEVALGPEVESEHYNFDCLNFPQDHPARDMQDTLYVRGRGGLSHAHQPGAGALYALPPTPLAYGLPRSGLSR